MYFADDYIALIPIYEETKFHSHPMIHLILSKDPIEVETTTSVKGRFIALASHIPHKVKATPKKTVVFLLDPGSTLGKTFVDTYLKEEVLCKSLSPEWEKNLESVLKDNRKDLFDKLLQSLNLPFNPLPPMDLRIEKIISGIKEGSLISFKVAELASTVCLSESRLTHLFKDNTGMNLKNYLLMNRMRVAFQLVLEKATITEAAHKAGFYDSAHLANLVRKTTGITLSHILK